MFKYSVFTAHKRSLGKDMFLLASVILSTGALCTEGYHPLWTEARPRRRSTPWTDTPRQPPQRAVCILLESILVFEDAFIFHFLNDGGMYYLCLCINILIIRELWSWKANKTVSDSPVLLYYCFKASLWPKIV